jgi:predicted dehydrogenase
MKMKVGIVGCGIIAGYHLPHILKCASAESVGVADINRKQAEDLARRFGLIHVFDDFETMFRDHRPDVVHVLTPPATHASLTVSAMQAGCHVLVEKPMALTVEDADAMVSAARARGVQLCVNHNFAYSPLVTKAHDLVQRGAAGRIVHVDANYAFDMRRSAGLYGKNDSRSEWILRLTGGPLADLVPHPVSLLLRFLPEPIQVHAVQKSNGMLPDNRPDELRALIDAGAITGSLSVSMGIKPDSFCLSIFGTHMTIQVGLANMTFVARENRLIPKGLFRVVDNFSQAGQMLASTVANTVKVLSGRMQPPGDVGPVISQFYTSLKKGEPPPVSGEDGRAVVALTQRIWERSEGDPPPRICMTGKDADTGSGTVSLGRGQ